MGAEISSPFQITNRQYEILDTAVRARIKKCRANAIICYKWNESKASTEMKARKWEEEADDLEELLSMIAQEFS